MLADVMPWICADGIATKCCVADVMALCVEQVADVMATGGRWNSHLRVDLILI